MSYLSFQVVGYFSMTFEWRLNAATSFTSQICCVHSPIYCIGRAWRKEFGKGSEWERNGMFKIISMEQFATWLVKNGEWIMGVFLLFSCRTFACLSSRIRQMRTTPKHAASNVGKFRQNKCTLLYSRLSHEWTFFCGTKFCLWCLTDTHIALMVMALLYFGTGHFLDATYQALN